MTYTYKYPHPAVATDCVVFGFDGKQLNILLIERGLDPFKGMWAFPGGFMRMDETAEACAQRELSEETGLSTQLLKQLGAFSGVRRDPRERVVSIAFYALVKPADVIGGDDANDARWFPIEEVPQLAFDHDFILRKAMQQLRKDIYFEPIGFELLGESFTMSELQRLYEAILGVHFDRRNFERKMLQTGILQAADPQPSLVHRDIDDLFPSIDSICDSIDLCCSSIESLSKTINTDVPQRHKPGRKGRLYSFNKEKYDHFKQESNFRFEF
ncbi:MAG: NUDIX hydrolase [Bacteroidales bacterium]|nr:NUDIX hydrolase [Bacteroidales bacterium]